MWAVSAFELSASHKLDDLFDTWSKAASLKSNYNVPMHTMLNTEPWKAQQSEEPSKNHARRFVADPWGRIHWKTW